MSPAHGVGAIRASFIETVAKVNSLFLLWLSDYSTSTNLQFPPMKLQFPTYETLVSYL